VKPYRRSDLRIRLGKTYYTLLRYLSWYSFRKKVTKTLVKERLPFLIFHHRSVLLRQLKEVDMQLQYNKVENLRLAIRKLNNLLIKPGETFSFWYLVGRTTRLKGYKKGMVLQNGELRSGYGGGLCQLSNLLYWMVLHSPLTIIERHRHSFDVFPDVNRSVPFGCGATVSYNYIDFQFRNDTEQVFQLHLWLTGEELCGDIYSDKSLTVKYEIVETDHIIKPEYGIGYSRHNRIYRKTFDLNSETIVNEELVAENHALLKYNPLLEAATASLKRTV
jgi:vancomycin resistance protein VanW